MSRECCLLIMSNPRWYAGMYQLYRDAYGIDSATFAEWVRQDVVDSDLSTPPGTLRFIDVEEEISPITPPRENMYVWRRILHFFHVR